MGYVMGGKPDVPPKLQWRNGDRVLWHGSLARHALRHGTGHEIGLNVTIVDGSVLGRSDFNRSIYSRSVKLFGTAAVVAEA